MIKDFLAMVYKIPLGTDYPLILSVSVFVCLAALNVLSFALNAMRFNKAPVLALVLATYILCVFKVLCDLYFGKHLSLDGLILSTLFCGASFLQFIPLFLLKSRALPLKKLNNRLIGRLSDEIDYTRNEQIYSSNPFKRIEILKTSRLGSRDELSEFGINFSGILKRTEELKQKRLSETDRRLIDNIEAQVQKLSLEKISDVEREQFSANLNRLIKLSAET